MQGCGRTQDLLTSNHNWEEKLAGDTTRKEDAGFASGERSLRDIERFD
jgi:hypothetical protein